MKIKTASFLSSSSSLNQCPQTNLPEFAFIGRSNVGKSSLINSLTNNGRLAMTSSNPGKTILINHFIINGEWYLVDLPGYGYARRSKEQIVKFDKMIRTYILQRQTMYCLFVLIDGNIPPQKIDIDFITWLGTNEVPFILVFTKSDKSKPGVYSHNVNAFLHTLEELWEELPPHFIVSSRNGNGREALLDYIQNVLKTDIS